MALTEKKVPQNSEKVMSKIQMSKDVTHREKYARKQHWYKEKDAFSAVNHAFIAYQCE